ncbi:MAG TPA: hypothetical protein VEG60_11620 [Candidatus Binatia bacterium]|nr:hypothetical protein [Candidatus Binatia bacterium]
MNSEREKREQEIERIMSELGRNRESDVAFQEEIKKTAAAMIEKETVQIEKGDRAERPKRPINPVTVGGWLLLLGAAALVFSMPNLGGVLLLCGLIVIVWATISRLSKPARPQHQNMASYSRFLKNYVSKWSKRYRR